jgi:hypothetical protein
LLTTCPSPAQQKQARSSPSLSATVVETAIAFQLGLLCGRQREERRGQWSRVKGSQSFRNMPPECAVQPKRKLRLYPGVGVSKIRTMATAVGEVWTDSIIQPTGTDPNCFRKSAFSVAPPED